ncbi:MAG: DUF4384 domain-containing protein [Bacteroidia bacterium]|nr:DUF4384 domain-containing protein [Bacteroidia bacterium]MDW8088928.1 hypothetical protein [Bacteroidia bacterium]
MRWLGRWVGLGGLLVWAQEKVVTGQAEVEVPPGWSIERAERQAYNSAILHALQTHFSTQVSAASKLVLRNRTEGQKAHTQTEFFLTADQYVEAEWLQTLKVQYQRQVRGGTVWVICKVQGRARPRQRPPLPLTLTPLRCLDTSRCATTEFLAGDPFYLLFRSPIGGYLQVFFEDSGRVFRLLPYQHQRQLAWEVRPDSTYLFFAPAAQSRTEAFWTDQFWMTAERPEVLHRLYILFSPHPLGAPPERFDRPQGLHTVALAEFHEWLLQERLRLPELNLRIIDLTVRQP